MSFKDNNFDKRLQRVEKASRARRARGSKPVVMPDGLIKVKPRRPRPGFPVKGIVLLLLGFFLFKGVMLAHLGDQPYDERVALLAQGTVVEQVGAVVLNVDPITERIAPVIRPIIE